MLARYCRVDAGGVVDFAYSAVSAVEQDDFGDYLRALAATDKAPLDRRQGAAFWLNLYNALAVSPADHPALHGRQHRATSASVCSAY